MNLDFNEEQQILRSAAREFLNKECPRELTRQRRSGPTEFNRELWHNMALLGWMGVTIDEAQGGSGGDFGDLAVLIEAMGEACLPAPFLATALLLPAALYGSANEAIRKQVLPSIAAGELVCSYACVDPGNSTGFDTISSAAEPDGDGYRISGSKLFVEYGQVADFFLTVTRSTAGELLLCLVEARSAGLELESHATLDYADQCELRFNNVAVNASQVIAVGEEAVKIVQRLGLLAAAAKCADMLGCIQAVLEMTVNYVAQREQFGQVVGSFQSIQHHCANMAVEVDSSRYLTRQAICKLSQEMPAQQDVAMAKAYVSNAAIRVCKLGHQTHGAISFCDELDMHLYLRRAHAAAVAFGDSEYHYEKVAAELGL